LELFILNYKGFSALLDGETVVKIIVPCAQQLATDASQYVRGALALEISGLGVLVGKEKYVGVASYSSSSSSIFTSLPG
jgi:hypothetical protein